MFNERDALKLRLEQLLIVEEKTIREFREERREILDRLRELDGFERQNKVYENSAADSSRDSYQSDKTLSPVVEKSRQTLAEAVESIHEGKKQSSGTQPAKEGRQNKGYHKKTLLLRDATMKILQSHRTAIPLGQLKKELELETGVEIKNISLFMTNLAKKESSLKKATHGQYMYIGN
ncbi:hypothetical protein JOC77_002486 [Peribacillus deserti]|uniref:Competence protein ComK n=1 Tax=Peribacillus deserti TaxID=673318 RepID=A0ABS2QIS3_9BACI|nr:hypothetical protein [Peribacillus deserti]MBM7693047.1 hypothetical protein [Peribacillus deserti]